MTLFSKSPAEREKYKRLTWKKKIEERQQNLGVLYSQVHLLIIILCFVLWYFNCLCFTWESTTSDQKTACKALLVWISKLVISLCCRFNWSACHLSPFHLSYVVVSSPCSSSEFYRNRASLTSFKQHFVVWAKAWLSQTLAPRAYSACFSLLFFWRRFF